MLKQSILEDLLLTCTCADDLDKELSIYGNNCLKDFFIDDARSKDLNNRITPLLYTLKYNPNYDICKVLLKYGDNAKTSIKCSKTMFNRHFINVEFYLCSIIIEGLLYNVKFSGEFEKIFKLFFNKDINELYNITKDISNYLNAYTETYKSMSNI